MSIATEIQRLQTAKANIKSAIEEKGVEVGNGTIDTYAEKINEISVGSGGIDYDTFWDNYQDNGNRTRYGSAFYGEGWNDTTFKPKYPIIISGDSSVDYASVFSYGGMTEINVDISIDAPSLQLAFNQNRSIVTIKKIILLRDDVSFDRTFVNATNLESITFEGVISKNIGFPSSSKLSNASIQSIIDHLADLTGGTTQTLTFHKTVGNKLTDTQKATITAKNWTLAY